MIRRSAFRIAALAGGTLVFLGVYGHARPGDALFGLLVAGVALAVSRRAVPRRANRPDGPRGGTADGPAPGAAALLRLAAETARGIVRDSWVIGRAAVRPTPPPPARFVEVPLGGRSESLVGVLGLAETIPPGSYLVEVDRDRDIAVFHLFNRADAPDVRRRQRIGIPEERSAGEEGA